MQTVVSNLSGDWTAIVPAGTTIADVDMTDPDYPAGYTQIEGSDPTVVTAVFNTDTFAGNDGFFQPGSISGLVQSDITGNGSGDIPIENVILTLLDGSGNPVDDLNQPGTQNYVVTTGIDGTYSFVKLPPGDYQVAETQPTDYLSVTDSDGGDPDLIGDPAPITVIVGSDSGNNNFVERALKPDTYAAWESANFGPADPDRFPASNPDGDLNSNLIEYAFCLDPETGIGAAICLEPRVGPGYDLVFHRRLGSHSDLEYCVLYIDDLANSTTNSSSWKEYALDSLPGGVTVTITPNADGISETVTISNIEALGAPAADKGFFTMAAKLDTNDDNIADVIHYTDVQGFQRTTIEVNECETFANPFLSKPVFSGKVEGVSGNNLQFGNNTNQGLDFTPGASGPILETGISYYAEILSGPLKGHRLDISTGGSGFVTLASDADLSSGAPFSTLRTDAGLPAGVNGAEIMIVEHLTLNDIAPSQAFAGSTDPANADRVLIPGNLPADGSGSWSTYFLLDHPSDPDYWALQGGGTTDRGGDVIPPCQGFFLHPKSQAVTLETFGMVRENDFACPLFEGSNLLAAVYPVDASPNDLGLQDDGSLDPNVEGSGDPANSDQIYLWNRDGISLTDTNGYRAYWYVDNGLTGPSQIQRWAMVGILTLTDVSSTDLLLGNRSFFLRSGDDRKSYLIEQPWTSLTPVN